MPGRSAALAGQVTERHNRFVSSDSGNPLPPPAAGNAAWTAPDPKLTLLQHLTELRARLLKCMISVLVLSVVGMVFAKPVFAWLMRPVLAALPADARTLIYTSGIEEVNVLLKVGLYAGLLLSTPVILWQVWGFISPGLLPEERRHSVPFILAGTTAFLAGVSFCYFAVLPQMFQWLLSEGQEREQEERLVVARQAEEDAVRFLRLGEPSRAAELAHGALPGLSTAASDGKSHAVPPARTGAEMQRRLDVLGQLVDALQVGFPASSRPTLVRVMERRVEAQRALQAGRLEEASVLADGAAALLASAEPQGTEGLAEVWALAKVRAQGESALDAERWTRPLLTMSEQLSLVLVLLVAFGLVFELPLVMALLTVLGLVKAAFLVKYQRHAFVLCLILAAVITPTGDVVNLLLMAGPMVLCYELGTLASWVIERRRNRTAASLAEAA
jgi:sec-independent protein translocase protein TatC